MKASEINDHADILDSLNTAVHALQAHNRNTAIAASRQLLQQQRVLLNECFKEGEPIKALLNARADLLDTLLTQIWQYFFPNSGKALALIAVGGYGRRELHPYSDVDLLLLCENTVNNPYKNKIGDFIALLWDLQLDIGHSVRSIEDCTLQALQDVTIVTNLLESRLIIGAEKLFTKMNAAIAESKIWSKEDFFNAKLEEQQHRHLKYHETAYRLEPNLKEGPGGLRDIQMISWVTRRYFGATTLKSLTELGFLTSAELDSLLERRELIWRIRFALHMLTGKCEDRLLFSHQTELAKLFSYQDNSTSLAVEQFMQVYFRAVTRLDRLNGMLLQLLQETIEYDGDINPTPYAIDEDFQMVHGYLEARDKEAFIKKPSLLLKIFLVMMQQKKPKGIRASTIRLITEARKHIDNKFREAEENRKIFSDILCSKTGIYREFMRMNRYGVLAAYLPEFEHVVGRMQFDLFHIYTVDVHTLFVLRNIRRFNGKQYAQWQPLCNAIFPTLDHPEILYIAALFHDIAKGRGGDHSKLGAIDVEKFCQRHFLSASNTEIIKWLVLNHLIMSMTAQRKDINDPVIIHAFANQVGNIEVLNYLYLLTVADIAATNPQLWTSWKDKLLQELYIHTKRVLEHDISQPLDHNARIEERKLLAEKQLLKINIPLDDYQSLWDDFGQAYFLGHTADEIAWHTKVILRFHSVSDHTQQVLVDINNKTNRGGSAIFIYAAESDGFFAAIATTLSRLKLNVVDARIITSKKGYTLDTYMVLDYDNHPIRDQYRTEEIKNTLTEVIQHPEALLNIKKRPLYTPRQLRHFDTATKIDFNNDSDKRYTIMELHALDRPGLLEQIGESFIQCKIRVHYAKISTVGESAEDTFMITDQFNRAITDNHQLSELRKTLTSSIDSS